MKVESGPSVFFMTATIVVLFGSAFFTDIIGVHAIFGTSFVVRARFQSFSDREMSVGAFLAGLIVPREGGLAIALTEKLEDMVTVLFLPLVSYHRFAASSVFADHSSNTSTSRYRDCRRIWEC